MSFPSVVMIDLYQLLTNLFLDAMYKIARDEGVRGLWSGTLPSIVLAINPAIQFMVYEAVKRRLQKYADAKAREHSLKAYKSEMFMFSSRV